MSKICFIVFFFYYVFVIIALIKNSAIFAYIKELSDVRREIYLDRLKQ